MCHARHHPTDYDGPLIPESEMCKTSLAHPGGRLEEVFICHSPDLEAVSKVLGGCEGGLWYEGRALTFWYHGLPCLMGSGQ